MRDTCCRKVLTWTWNGLWQHLLLLSILLSLSSLLLLLFFIGTLVCGSGGPCLKKGRSMQMPAVSKLDSKG